MVDDDFLLDGFPEDKQPSVKLNQYRQKSKRKKSKKGSKMQMKDLDDDSDSGIEGLGGKIHSLASEMDGSSYSDEPGFAEEVSVGRNKSAALIKNVYPLDDNLVFLIPFIASRICNIGRFSSFTSP